MCKCGYCLHLNGVALIQRVVEYAWCINNLPTCVLVVGVANKQILSRERVRLHVDVSVGNIVDEAGLSDVREAGYYQCPCISVYLWQSRQMFAYLFQIR